MFVVHSALSMLMTINTDEDLKIAGLMAVRAESFRVRTTINIKVMIENRL